MDAQINTFGNWEGVGSPLSFSITSFTEEEWMYVSRSGDSLPAIWEPSGSRHGTSLYATLEDTWKELKLSPEYKMYFQQKDYPE